MPSAHAITQASVIRLRAIGRMVRAANAANTSSGQQDANAAAMSVPTMPAMRDRGVELCDATRGQYEAVGAQSAARNAGGGTALTRESDAS